MRWSTPWPHRLVLLAAADDPGVLVLSRFAGPAEELTGAIIINPLDPIDIVESLQTALTMPLNERRRRWEPMFEHLRRNDIHRWRAGFVAALAGPAPAET